MGLRLQCWFLAHTPDGGGRRITHVDDRTRAAAAAKEKKKKKETHFQHSSWTLLQPLNRYSHEQGEARTLPSLSLSQRHTFSSKPDTEIDFRRKPSINREVEVGRGGVFCF